MENSSDLIDEKVESRSENSEESILNSDLRSAMKRYQIFLFKTVVGAVVAFAVLLTLFMLLPCDIRSCIDSKRLIRGLIAGFGISIIEIVLLSWSVERVTLGLMSPKKARAQAMFRLVVVALLLVFGAYKYGILSIIGFVSGFILVRISMVLIHWSESKSAANAKDGEDLLKSAGASNGASIERK